MNHAIRAREVRVVAPDGEQIGVKKIDEALWLADQLGMDLVEVAPEAKPPVCRLMDYGKFKYEQSVRQREARKKQTRTVIKEVRMRPRIGVHDFDIVRRRSEEFLMEGDKVKVTIRFRGRENERPELGHQLIERLIEQLGDLASVEQRARKDGRTMTMVMAPTRKALSLKKAEMDQKAEDRRVKSEGKAVPEPDAEPEETTEIIPEPELATEEVTESVAEGQETTDELLASETDELTTEEEDRHAKTKDS